MSSLQNWVVCEESGRWTAALRIAFARRPKTQQSPLLYEVRTLGELSTRLEEHRVDLALVEVNPKNLSHLLQLLLRSPPEAPRYAILCDDTANDWPSAAVARGNSNPPHIADLLWEVGPAEVVESPRQLAGLLSLHDRMAACCIPLAAHAAAGQSMVDWAQSMLPWQER